MFELSVPQTVTVVKTRPAPKSATQTPTEPTLTFTAVQWAATRNGMLAELLLQQDGADPRILRSQWDTASQGDFDEGRAMLRGLLTEAGWTL